MRAFARVLALCAGATIASTGPLFAAPAAAPAAAADGAYLAANPGALLSFSNSDFILRSVMPAVLFGQESGVVVACGRVAGGMLIEGRAGVGTSNYLYAVLQGELSLAWCAGGGRAGFYCGGALRYWDLVLNATGLQTHNLAALAAGGWRFDLGPAFVDLRLYLPVAVASYAAIEGARPGIAWCFSPLPGISPVLPIGLLQVGVWL